MANRKLTVEPVQTEAERREFVYFQWQVYRDDPNWVPPLISDRMEMLDPERHPFHRHSEVALFIARRDGEPVGTIAAILNNRHNAFQNEEVGFFGFFEVLHDREAAEALLETAADWVRGQGMSAIRGPANFSTNEEVGLLIDGWNGPPVALMTYNPRYYVDYIEGAGFEKAMDLLAYMLDLEQYGPNAEGLPPKLLRVCEKIKERRGYRVRRINMRRFDEEVDRFKTIYNSAWAKNWGFVPLTEPEIEHLAKGLRVMADPSIVLFVEHGDETVAAMVPLPDLNQALIRAYPQPGVPEWWTLAKFFWHWKVRGQVDTMRAFAGGVLEEHRGRGVDAVLFVELAKAAIPKYKRCEMSWVLENNLMMRRVAQLFDAEVYRTYRVYEKAL